MAHSSLRALSELGAHLKDTPGDKEDHYQFMIK
jgi:hypothetical protein